MIYSERLLERGSFLTRLAHRRRYRRTLELAAGIRGAVAIDFGCGDGMLLRRAYDQGIIQSGYGVDSNPEMRRSAWGFRTNLRFGDHRTALLQRFRTPAGSGWRIRGLSIVTSRVRANSPIPPCGSPFQVEEKMIRVV
jgi:hypothetical protein